MILTLSWLKNHLNTKASINEIIEKLTNIGLEVEGIKEGSGSLSEFKIAKILKTEKHPNADKLKLCDVTTGGSSVVKVVCGADNARDGLVTVYAPPGATIPKSKMKLKIAKIRGVESRGMLCSESELNLSEESAGIIELKNMSNKIGKSFFKSSTEKVIDLSITPNRPDCLGIRGIARDLAAAGVGKLLDLKKNKINQKKNQNIKISITKEKNQGCSAFGSCLITGIKNQESPKWLKDKINSLGLKPISAVVDITNYVMFDLNRPLHAYDADKIDKEIIVRNSKKGESFMALDDKKYNLQKDMCVIADKSGVLGLGGVIGGTRSGTEMETRNILLESAYFLPSSIRKTSKQLGLETDAKYRFERGIDPNSIIDGLKIATDLILKICGGEASKFNIAGKKEYKSKPIELELGKFKKIIGFDITVSETKKILNSLGFSIKSGKKKLKVLIPTWRPDVNQEIDLIEELIRIKGFDKINLVEPEKIRNTEINGFKSAGVLLYTDEGFWMGLERKQRKNKKFEEYWCDFGGKREGDETAFETAQRECLQECGVDISKLTFEHYPVYHPDSHSKHAVFIVRCPLDLVPEQRENFIEIKKTKYYGDDAHPRLKFDKEYFIHKKLTELNLWSEPMYGECHIHNLE